MPERHLYQEWRAANENTRFPFAATATLQNDAGRLLTDGTIIDAALTVIGAQERLYLSQVVIDHQEVTLTVGDGFNAALASGTFPLVNADDLISLTDSYGRPAGVLVSESRRLGIFQSWGVGTHEFRQEQSEFAATVCFPTPEIGVRGFLLETGELFTGDVWLVGDDGVVFRTEHVVLPGGCNLDETLVQVLRVDIVGDPLFRRRLCTPQNLFVTPRFIKTLRLMAPNLTYDCGPDENGNMVLATGSHAAADTILRLVPKADGLRVAVVGSAGSGVTS